MSPQEQNPDGILHLRNTIEGAFHQLPPEHQATMGLILFKEILEGEWGSWFDNAIKRLHETKPTPATPLTLRTITLDDLHDAGLTDEDIKTLTPNDLNLITQRIEEHLTWDVLPDETRFMTDQVIDEKKRR